VYSTPRVSRRRLLLAVLHAAVVGAAAAIHDVVDGSLVVLVASVVAVTAPLHLRTGVPGVFGSCIRCDGEKEDERVGCAGCFGLSALWFVVVYSYLVAVFFVVANAAVSATGLPADGYTPDPVSAGGFLTAGFYAIVVSSVILVSTQTAALAQGWVRREAGFKRRLTGGAGRVRKGVSEASVADLLSFVGYVEVSFALMIAYIVTFPVLNHFLYYFLYPLSSPGPVSGILVAAVFLFGFVLWTAVLGSVGYYALRSVEFQKI